MHVDYPLGCGPLPGRIYPSGSPKVVCTVASLYLTHGYFSSQVTPCWYWKYGLEATFLFSLLLFWGTEARGLHALTVASYHAAPSTVFPTREYRGVAPSICGRTLWCRLLHGRSYPWVSGGGAHRMQVLLGSDPSQRPRPVNTRGLTVSLLP